MSLRKKIIFSFIISASIISILTIFEYVNFIQVRNEMRFLEVTGTIRNISLELRRHEKNFFLFPDKAEEEAQATLDYLAQLGEVTDGIKFGDPAKRDQMRELVSAYGSNFAEIERLLLELSRGFAQRPDVFAPYQSFLPLTEAYSRDKPDYVASFLQEFFSLPPDDTQVQRLRQLDSGINALRQTGEDIIATADELDKSARDQADRGIQLSQNAILVFFPLFLLFGISALLYISTGVVKRLKTLTVAIEQIGKRYTSSLAAQQEELEQKDEVDVLINKFGRMNTQLRQWENELYEKNQELVQSKKLAAIGTMASGVAHELNNPLNNINLSAQVLQRTVGPEAPPALQEIVADIMGQTARLKGVVGNLLEFAREREPQLQPVPLGALVRGAFQQVAKAANINEISFSLDPQIDTITLRADPDQLERVFVNLFSNAVAAMDGRGQLSVDVEPSDRSVKLWVADSGRGISLEDREKVFDPFFTKKDKGTGLGLTIVMNIIKKHGGNIAVISDEGMGTIFEITFPREQER